MLIPNTVKPGMFVGFLNEGSYQVESVELDVVYLLDKDGSSFTATAHEIKIPEGYIS